MASVLNKFEEKTKILASKVNENFEMLQSDIRTLDEATDSKLSSTKENILSDIETVKESLENGKADIDLKNVEASQKFIDNVFNWLAPDLENKIDVTNLPFKAPSYGYWHHFGINTLGYVYINGIRFDHYLWHTSGTAPGHQSLTFLLSPGDEVTYEQNKPKNMYFIPCKGLLMGVKDDE